jgi:DNA-3-methyladenine glycosylase
LEGNLNRVPRAFYRRHGVLVAPELLGLLLVHETADGVTAGLIVEDEAYIGPEDRACHAYGGRITRRNRAMYGPPGTAYVYFTYGMHYCFNIVAAEEGVPHAILIRALEPIDGLDLMAIRRGRRLPLATGPARVCQAMGIDLSHNGADLVNGELYLAFPPARLSRTFKVGRSPRIGVNYAGEARDYLWRFFIEGNPFVSHTAGSRPGRSGGGRA